MTRTFRRWVLVATIVGLAASASSLYVHYRLLTDPGYASPCDINATFGCSQAYLSPYGSVFGVPVALFGFLWFAFVAMFVLLGARTPPAVQRNVPGYLLGLSIVGFGVILYLGYAAFFVLKELCLFCLVTYAAVIALLVLSAAWNTTPMTTLPRRLFRDLRVLALNPLALFVIGVFLAGAGSAIAFFPSERTEGDARAAAGQAAPPDRRADIDTWFVALPRENVAVPNGGAAVLIVKFTDYQCPTCGLTERELKPVLERFEAEMPGAVRLVVKDFPWDLSCNAQAVKTLHPAACAAAAAVHMAEQNGRRAQMEDYLYANQSTLTPASVEQAARWIGNVADWNQQLPAAMSAVAADLAIAQPLQIRATPTFFVNGVRLPQLLTAAAWDYAIRVELKRLGRLK